MTPEDMHRIHSHFTQTWKHTPQKLTRSRFPRGWWILPAVAVGGAIWFFAAWLAGVL